MLKLLLKAVEYNGLTLSTIKIGLLYGIFWILLIAPSFAGSVGVLISKEISPFIMMVEGLESNLDLQVCRIFLGSDNIPYSQAPCFKSFDERNFSILVAVGPQALSYIIDTKLPIPFIYAMVLYPEKFYGIENASGGVSLNLSIISKQISIIRQVLPYINRLGVLFDPQNNQDWFAKAKEIASLNGVILNALEVRNRSEISSIFKGDGPDVDAILFIPDRTVISRTIVQYVIKKGISYKIPSIGYNKFFHESGALLSFVVDYKEVGRQIAIQVKSVNSGKKCEPIGPIYKVLLNKKVVKALNLKIGRDLPPIVEGY